MHLRGLRDALKCRLTARAGCTSAAGRRSVLCLITELAIYSERRGQGIHKASSEAPARGIRFNSTVRARGVIHRTLPAMPTGVNRSVLLWLQRYVVQETEPSAVRKPG
jgi:hypothetical protein